MVTADGHELADLAPDAVIGTSSVRRRAQLLRRWPRMQVRPLRGYVNTRLANLDAGEYDAMLAAVCGLRRVGHADRITEVLPVEVLCPPVGAGLITVQARAGDVSSYAERVPRSRR